MFEATPGAPANAGLGIIPRCSPVSCWLARHSANSSLLIEPHAVYGGPTGGVDVRDKTGSKTLGRAVGVEDVHCSPAREGDAYHASFVKQLQPPVAVTTRLQAGQFRSIGGDQDKLCSPKLLELCGLSDCRRWG